MRILVINGSPKGEYSITLQTIRYLEILHPEHQFEVLHVGQRIRALEKDFSPVLTAVNNAQLLLFSYPVYTFIAPYQLHRFIELLKASGVSLTDKYATQLTTSKRFYDITAHRFIEDNCHDFGMRYIRGLSADMDDLTTEKGRKEAEEFLAYVEWCIKEDVCVPVPAECPPVTLVPATVMSNTEEKQGNVVILTDACENDTLLQGMIDRFRAVLPLKSRVINIREYPFKGGCLGCFHCAVSGKCVHKDGFDDFLRKEIETAQAIVYAFTIRDHSMGVAFKRYNDRQFCNGHRTVTMGMPQGYLISGAYSREFNLQTIVEARAQVGGNFMAGVATNEQNPDGQIDRLAKNIVYALENRYVPPQNFWGIGGMKVFRDLIWLMQGMMKADHKFYKAHGQYDFPQKKWPTMLKMYLVGALLSSPAILAKMGNKMNEGMVAPYKKALELAKKRMNSNEVSEG